MMENATSRSAPTRLLIGLAIDLSASMKQSLRHPTREKKTGDERFRRPLDRLARQAKQVIQTYRTRDGEAFTELFVYGFGLGYLQACDLFSLLEIGAEKFAIDDAYAELENMAREHNVSPLKVRAAWPVIKANAAAARFVTAKLKIDPQARKHLAELLASSRKPKTIADNVKAYVQELIARPFEDTTLSIEQVVSLWENSGKTLENVEGLIYGEETPLRDALMKIKARFDRELASRPDDTNAILLVLSDGIATDGDPLPVIEELKAMGVTVVAAFVTSEEAAHHDGMGPGGESFDDIAGVANPAVRDHLHLGIGCGV